MTTSFKTLFLLLAAGSPQALAVTLSHRCAPLKACRECPASRERLRTAQAWPRCLQVWSGWRVVPGLARSQGVHAPTLGRASRVTSSSKAAGENGSDEASLAWDRDDATAAPVAWAPWSWKVPAAPGGRVTQDQGTDGARRPRAGGLTSTLSPRQN